CGFTKARCASLASGVICGFLDPDDALTENALETMIASFGKHQDASMISSKYYLTDLNLNVTKAGSHGEQIPPAESYLTYGKAAITAFAAFRKSSYDQTSGISPEFKRAVDQDLYYKMEEVGTPYYVDEFLYLYRINDNSISANANVFKAMYWHFRAKKEAYQRQKKNKTKAKNIEDNDFKEYANLYYINRLKRAGRLKKLGSKYYFLWKSIQTSPRLDWKYKVLCFVRPNFF